MSFVLYVAYVIDIAISKYGLTLFRDLCSQANLTYLAETHELYISSHNTIYK